MEFVIVTAAYSNAVLVAILPFLSDFAKKVELPMKAPITMNQVAKFRCDPRKGQIGGVVWLTNGFEFLFERGGVRRFRSDHSYYSLQDPDEIRNYRGQLRMTEGEAVSLYRAALKRLGYSGGRLDTAPVVERAANYRGQVVPHYRIRWFDPPRHDGSPRTYIDGEVNAGTGRIEMVSLLATNFDRAPPKVAIEPVPIPRTNRPSGGIPLAPVSPRASNEIVTVVLGEISTYARKLGLPVAATLRRDAVKTVGVGLLPNGPSCQIVFTNGHRFNYSDGFIKGWNAPDSYFSGDWKRSTSMREDDFLGPLNVPQAELVAIAKAQVSKLGYSDEVLQLNKPHALIAGPDPSATHDLTRFLYQWGDLDPMTASFIVAVEMDVRTKSAKSIYIRNPKLARPFPKNVD